MKLLVFAHTPPPLHGQSLMVETLVEGLTQHPEIEILHVNARLSRDSRDIGRWRPGKVILILQACVRAWRLRLQHGPALLYYVPAPGKRSALYRDLLVMALCRPFFSGLVLHWHAAGLAGWLDQHAHPLERWLAKMLLGRADLSIVLGENLQADATGLNARRVSIVRNGIRDPEANGVVRSAASPTHVEALFLGLCSRDKGLFDAIAAVQLANARAMPNGNRLIRLRIAGDFPDAATEREFLEAIAPTDGAVRYEGFVQGEAKDALLRRADVLIFPTWYAHEAQPLVIAEALAFDLPVIITRWRAVHEGLPTAHVHLVEPHRPDHIADALDIVRTAGSPGGTLRAHFLAHFTRERHLAALSKQLILLQPVLR